MDFFLDLSESSSKHLPASGPTQESKATAVNSIFSTYSTGENRVTASCMAVLQSLALRRIERLLGALLEQSEFELVRFQNQVAKGGQGVPDAVIHASVRLFIETKIDRNAVKVEQIKRHVRRLDEAKEATTLLLVLTPDDVRPPVLDSLRDERVAWASFAALDQAIDELLGDKNEVTSEREAFLLRELQNMLAAEGLLRSDNDVVIVAARHAWPEYQDVHAYVCQPNRPFQLVSRLGFYCKGQIYPLVPKVLAVQDDVQMVSGMYPGALGELVDTLVRKGMRPEGELFKVFLLSAPDSLDTLVLPQPIKNDLRSKAGKPTAFTMGQRYVSSERLVTAKATSDLI